MLRTVPGRLALATAAALLCPALPLPSAAAGTPAAADPACAAPVLDDAQPVSEAVPELSTTEQHQVAAANDMSVGDLREVAGDGPSADDTLWLDRCGLRFYVERPAPAAGSASGATAAAATPSTATVGPAGPLADTFSLQSDPTATRTIYLDFDGQTVTGTAWNSTTAYGPTAVRTITAAPYDIDGDPATFSAAERTEIQRAWLVVVEDYAPYRVNVTTRDPGTAALTRSGSADTAYGMRVVITPGGPIYRDCQSRCGGIAYVGVFDESGSAFHQPAWVFTGGTGTDGVALAQAVSHEVGHTLGLEHDGNATEDYETGSSLWAPIMGVSYYAPLTQWSKGEYAGANNHQDDTAIIGGVLRVRPDDRGNGLASAEALPDDGSSQRSGLIETRADVDAFTLRTGTETTLSVQPTGYQPDVDLSLTVTDAASGRVVASVDPASSRGRGVAANGLGASYRLPAGPETTYLITVDGVGNGSPLVTGQYNDYGSQGAYRLTAVAGVQQPLAVTTPEVEVTGTVGQRWDALTEGAFGVTGGTAPYTFSASQLPPGATVDSVSGLVSGAIGAAGSWSATLTVTDATGTAETIGITFVARPRPVTSAPTTATTPTPATAAPAPAWTKVAVGRARVKHAYRGRLAVRGGTGTLRWRVTGRLPAGVRLKVAPGGRQLTLTGRARHRGRWHFVLRGTDAAGRVLARKVTLVVKR